MTAPNAPGRRPFRLPAGRRQAAADVARELRFHLEMCEADLVAAGMTPADARAEARRRFGDPDAVAAECRDIEGGRQSGARWRDALAAWRQDLAYALRALRRAPGFAAAAVLTLALGVGGTVAMFSVVDAVLLRPLPLRDPGRVVSLATAVGGEPRTGSPALFAAWGEQSRRLAGVAALREREATLLGGAGSGGEAERVSGFAVSGTFFSTLGLSPMLGRALGPADDAPGAPPVAVIGRRLWERRFGGDARALGRTLRLDGTPHTVVGVFPPALDGTFGDREFLVPLALPASQRGNFTPYLVLLGRLAPGATPAAAARELDAVIARLGAPALDDGVRPVARVEPLDRTLTADYRRPLLLLLGAVGAALLIGAANVATLVLVRSVGRARELAVRASLGAGRARLVRQLAAEHLVLGVLAAAAAVPVAAFGVRALMAAAPAGVPRLAEAGLDGRALAAAAALGVLASALCGVAPALFLGRIDLRGVLAGGGRTATDRRGERWRRVLVGAEVALAVVLLTGAGLLVRSAAALGRVRPGFDVAHVLTGRFALPERDYPDVAGAVRAYEAVLASARRQPGVAGAALVSRVPLGGSMTSVDLDLADRPFARETKVNAALRIASPGYFRSMGIPLLAGRDLRPADDARAAPVAVINAALARRLTGGAPALALGRRVRSDNGAFADAAGRPRELEVVGVVGDVRDLGPRGDAAPEFYAPLGQVSDEPWNYWVGREMVLVARVDPRAPGGAAAAAPALRRAVAAVDPRVPLYDVQTTGARLGGALAVERFSTRLLVVLGAFGLLLAALGIHGVVAYAAAQRTREVGVRLALGGTARQAVGLVVRRCLRPVVAGLAVGGAAALLAARAASGLLFGVSPLDPVSVLGAALLLAAVGAAAGWAPARRVARVSPAQSLRHE